MYQLQFLLDMQSDSSNLQYIPEIFSWQLAPGCRHKKSKQDTKIKEFKSAVWGSKHKKYTHMHNHSILKTCREKKGFDLPSTEDV